MGSFNAFIDVMSCRVAWELTPVLVMTCVCKTADLLACVDA